MSASFFQIAADVTGHTRRLPPLKPVLVSPEGGTEAEILGRIASYTKHLAVMNADRMAAANRSDEGAPYAIARLTGQISIFERKLKAAHKQLKLVRAS